MIRAFTQTVDAGLDLLEAEGRLARLHLLRMVSAGALLLLCALLGAAGILGFAIGVVLALHQVIGLPLAIIAVSTPIIVTACVIAWRVADRVLA